MQPSWAQLSRREFLMDTGSASAPGLHGLSGIRETSPPGNSMDGAAPFCCKWSSVRFCAMIDVVDARLGLFTRSASEEENTA